VVITSVRATARSFLLDTNVLIDGWAGDTDIVQRLERLPAEAIFVPVVVLGELYFGARRSTRTAENLANLDTFTATANGVSCDLATARVYGEIKTALRRLGRPLPENDIWIAAIAIQHGLTLVSRDAHFDQRRRSLPRPLVNEGATARWIAHSNASRSIAARKIAAM